METRCSRRKRSAGGRLGGRHLGVEHDQGGGGLPLPSGAPHGSHHAAVRHLLLVPHPAAAPHLPEPPIHPTAAVPFFISSPLFTDKEQPPVYGGSDMPTLLEVFIFVSSLLPTTDGARDIAMMLMWHDINRPGLLGPHFRVEVSPSDGRAGGVLRFD